MIIQSKVFLLLLMILFISGCIHNNVLNIKKSNNDVDTTVLFEYQEKNFPFPFYEKNGLIYEKTPSGIFFSGEVRSSFDAMKNFFLIQSDQSGWCLEIAMTFESTIVLEFRKKSLKAIVLIHKKNGLYVVVDLMIG